MFLLLFFLSSTRYPGYLFIHPFRMFGTCLFLYNYYFLVALFLSPLCPIHSFFHSFFIYLILSFYNFFSSFFLSFIYHIFIPFFRSSHSFLCFCFLSFSFSSTLFPLSLFLSSQVILIAPFCNNTTTNCMFCYCSMALGSSGTWTEFLPPWSESSIHFRYSLRVHYARNVSTKSVDFVLSFIVRK